MNDDTPDVSLMAPSQSSRVAFLTSAVVPLLALLPLLAITTAVLTGATPGHATAMQIVSGFQAGIGVTAVVNGLLIMLTLSGLVANRSRRLSLQPTA